MAKFAVFGSSYVARLEKYCDGDMKGPGCVTFFEKGGMRVDAIPRAVFSDLLAYNPDTVVIQLGGNDITATSSPNDIFDRLMQLERDLRDAGTNDIYFAEIVPSGNFDKSPGLTLTSFKKQRNKINRLLKTRLKDHYIDLRVNYPDDCNRDLVHFNKSGLRTQYFAMRRPFFRF